MASLDTLNCASDIENKMQQPPLPDQFSCVLQGLWPLLGFPDRIEDTGIFLQDST